MSYSQNSGQLALLENLDRRYPFIQPFPIGVPDEASNREPHLQQPRHSQDFKAATPRYVAPQSTYARPDVARDLPTHSIYTISTAAGDARVTRRRVHRREPRNPDDMGAELSGNKQEPLMQTGVSEELPPANGEYYPRPDGCVSPTVPTPSPCFHMDDPVVSGSPSDIGVVMGGNTASRDARAPKIVEFTDPGAEGNSAPAKEGLYCPFDECRNENGLPKRFFSRKADVSRHVFSTHSKATHDCPKPRCARKGDDGFTRRDHLIEHLRGFHNQDIPKRQHGGLKKRRAEKRTSGNGPTRRRQQHAVPADGRRHAPTALAGTSRVDQSEAEHSPAHQIRHGLSTVDQGSENTDQASLGLVTLEPSDGSPQNASDSGDIVQFQRHGGREHGDLSPDSYSDLQVGSHGSLCTTSSLSDGWTLVPFPSMMPNTFPRVEQYYTAPSTDYRSLASSTAPKLIYYDYDDDDLMNDYY